MTKTRIRKPDKQRRKEQHTIKKVKSKTVNRGETVYEWGTEATLIKKRCIEENNRKKETM